MAIVTEEQVIKVMRQYNPWWKNPAAINEETINEQILQSVVKMHKKSSSKHIE